MTTLLIYLFAVALLFSSQAAATFDEAKAHITDEEHPQHRNLLGQERKPKRKFKAERLKKLVDYVEHNPPPLKLELAEWSKPHNVNGNAIFAIALGDTLMGNDVKNFAGTARKSGYTGDIVMAVIPTSRTDFFDKLKEYNVVTYLAPSNCGFGAKTKNEVGCAFAGSSIKASINMIRYYIYELWSLQYSKDSLILVSDFSDVFFQSDPFIYNLEDWRNDPTRDQLAVYLEAHPNAVIGRCPFNGGWIEKCYGHEVFQKVKSNTVSCSGNTFGTRNAILAYAYLMTKQMDPEVRYGRNTTLTNKGCVSVGMDQGFHNYLIYMGVLGNYMDVKIFEQGEGAVNVMGGFYGERKTLKFTLKDWKILRGDAPNMYVHNWNGDKSPVVHQLDRFKQSEIKQGYTHYLGVMQGLGGY